MGAARIIILVIAAVAALGLAVVVRNMAAGRPADQPVAVAAAQPVQAPRTRVLVAKQDLPIGTRLEPAHMTWQPWPADAINPLFITDGSAPTPAAATPADKVGAQAVQAAKAAQVAIGGDNAMQALTGAIVREPFLANEPIVRSKIVRGGEGSYMSVVIQPGMRGVAIPVTVETGAGGFILPGDRVDVLMSRKIDMPNPAGGGSIQTGAAEVVMNNVRVLAIDQQIQPEKDARALVGATATLEIAAADVPVLLRARAQGDLSLALRSYADIGAASGAAGADNSRAAMVTVIRGGTATEVMAR